MSISEPKASFVEACNLADSIVIFQNARLTSSITKNTSCADLEEFKKDAFACIRNQSCNIKFLDEMMKLKESGEFDEFVEFYYKARFEHLMSLCKAAANSKTIYNLLFTTLPSQLSNKLKDWKEQQQDVLSDAEIALIDEILSIDQRFIPVFASLYCDGLLASEAMEEGC
jgi:hypothetical protein